MEQSLIQSVYDRISHRPDDCTIASLADEFQISEQEAGVVIDALEKRGLVKHEADSVIPIKWWEQPHVEVMLNVPFIDEDVFREYCQDIDAFSLQLRIDGINALRPYAHETAVEIILGVAAGFGIAEFFKAFLGELGKKLATFVHESVEKHRKKGINQVEIKGARNLTHHSISFSLKGSDVDSVTNSFASLSESLEKAQISGAIKKLAEGDELSVSGAGWTATVRRTNSESQDEA